MQYLFVYQVLNIAQGSVGRAQVGVCPERRSDFIVGAFPKHVYHPYLAFVQAYQAIFLPEFRLFECVRKGVFGIDQRSFEAVQKPHQPFGDVQIAVLRPFEHVVIEVFLLTYLRRQAVQVLREAIGARQEQVGQYTRNVSVSLVKRVDKSQSQMGYAGFYDRIGRMKRVEPFKEVFHFVGDGGWILDI